nr:non-ribosomal peptide synthase/polyketide synthase [Pseudomonas daroniae]
MWFLWQLDPQGAAYNLPMAVRLNGELDSSALQSAFDGLVARHETLRSVFSEQDGQVSQRIVEPFAVAIVSHDLTGLNTDKREEQVRILADAEALAPFDLAQGPLLRVQLLKLAEQEHVLLLTLHHIVADGWSYNVLIDEFIRLYDAACSGTEADLQALPIQYRDYALWQRSWLEAGEQERQLDYWRGKLGEDHAPLELPTDHPRPLSPSYRGARHQFQVDPAQAERLRGLAREQGVTLFMVLLAAFKVLLHRYSGQQAIRVGVPVANRSRTEVEGLIGCFINTQVLHTDIDPLIDVRELLQRVKETALGAQGHQELPFERLVEALGLDRSLSVNPLFQVMFNHQSQVADAGAIKGQSGLSLAALERETRIAQFDLSLDTYEKGGRLFAAFGYAVDVFEPSTIERLAGHWCNVLEALLARPGQRIADLQLLAASEFHQLVHDWNRTEQDFPRHSCIHQLFEAQVEKTPDALAVVSGEQELTYRELNRRSNQLAWKLKALGVGPDVMVGIAVDRSIELPVGLLAILKAGGAYVPLDPEYPQERLAYMLEDSRAQVLLTQACLLERLPAQWHENALLLEQLELASFSSENPVSTVTPANLAYSIYTSGSTGKPKGVLIEHRNATALIGWARTIYSQDDLQGVLASTSICFDLSVWEFFVTLSSGGYVVLAQNALELPYLKSRERVRLVNTVPSAIKALYDAGQLPASVRTINLAGEALKQPLVNQLYASGAVERVYDLYGPSEDTTYSTFTRREPNGQANIGRPLSNSAAYLLDGSGQPVPTGLLGELYLAGAGISRGYLGRPALTAEKFLPNPFDDNAASGGRLYRTGDLARYRQTGEIEYIGRIDHQVKVRGFRIELGEIETRLQAHGFIREAVVIDIEEPGGSKQLVAYFTLDSGVDEPLPALYFKLKSHLKSQLPDYMVPAHFVHLERLPLTASGKLDRKALPKPDAQLQSHVHIAPQGGLEEQVAAIWAGVLGIEVVGRNDNFFELGGHSLLATQVVSRIRQQCGIELPLRALFESQDLTGFCLQIAKSESADALPLSRIGRDQPLVLSYAQQRQWFIWKLEPESAAYHVPAALRLRGGMDIVALGHAFDTLIQRHETLRTVFLQDAGQPVQIIQPDSRFALMLDEWVDAEQESDARIQAFIEAEVRTPFDLEQGPLLRARLLKVTEQDHVLILTLHHIVTDGWSSTIIVDELIRLYDAYRQGLPADLPILAVQYADYAAWQRAWLKAGEQDRQLQYWQAELSGEQPVLELPFDHPRPLIRTYAGSQVTVDLAPELMVRLKGMAQAQGATLFTALLASFQALLHRYSGQSDIRVGVPVANRTRAETEGLIGFFVNTQVLRADLDPDTNFEALLQQVRQRVMGAQMHQDLPFEQLVEALQPERNLSHSPLFQVMYNHRSETGAIARQFDSLGIERLDWEVKTTQFDLTLDTYETEKGLKAALTYMTDLFEKSTVERLLGHWMNMLEAMLDQPQRRLGELPVASEVQQLAVLQDWNPAEASYPSEQCLHHLIAEQALQSPDAIAVTLTDQQLTYCELDGQANRLAHKLVELGVGPDVLVGLAVERSLEMVVGLLAILKAGGAYVPLDPEYPADRLAYMIEDSAISLLLTQAHLLEYLPVPDGVQVLFLESLDHVLTGYAETAPHVAVQPDNLAYVIYTSGSTGKPKGTLLPHRNVLRLFKATQDWFHFDGSDVWTLFHSYAFDFSVWELFGALLHGARLVVVPRDVSRSPEDFHTLLQRERVTVLNQTPSAFRQLMRVACESDASLSLRTVIFGGEALEVQSLRPWFDRFGDQAPQLVNMYGITETTVHVTYRPLSLNDLSSDVGSPIGEAIPDLSWYVLNAQLTPVLPGTTGELHVGRAGLCRGYLNRPGLTAERFVPDPFDRSEQGGGRLYRTGDLVQYRADGVIEYVGRIDHQVKIRGFRIELGEIEARLNEQAAVREAVVLAQEGVSGPQLVGYVVLHEAIDAQDQAGQRDVLKAALKEHLPDYMVPAHWLFLDQLPLTANGKLDRKALPKPDASLLQQGYVAPQSELQQRIAAIWADVLKLEQVGLTDNFFELGGDSIISIQVVSRARQAGIRFTPKELFQHQTVQGLASVAREGEDGAVAICQGPAVGRSLLLPIHQSFFDAAIPDRHHWNQSLLLKPGQPLNGKWLEQALQALVQHHDALRLGFAEQADGQWSAQYRSIGETRTLLWQATVQGSEELEPLCNEAQRSLSLQDGPLLRAVLVSLADGSQRLLLVIHHLVVDGVSWRILLEDLQAAYCQLKNGLPVRLAAKTSSTQAWAGQLQAYAASDALQQELGYWTTRLQGGSSELPRDNPAGSLHGKSAANATTRLDQDWTHKLLQAAPAAYRTQINDLLLTALARVIARWIEQPDVLVQLEGHGREDLFDSIDLTRTVGWFTSMFPVKLTPQAHLAGSIKQIKEQLRAVPNKGIGFGALRYLGDEQARQVLAQLPQPRITFNYLGQFDGSFVDARKGEQADGAFFTPAPESAGLERAIEAPLDNWLSINGQVYGGELSLGWTFSREMFDEATIQRLADEYAQELKHLIEHCSAEETAGVTPSDFPLVQLTQAQLDALPVPALEIEDIYPLSPMQQGMLFHTLYQQEAGDYINQMRVDIQRLDIARFKSAWQSALQQHDILRSAFVFKNLDVPLQVVRKTVSLPFKVCDWRGQVELQAALDSLAEGELKDGHVLSEAPLLKLAVVRTGDSTCHLIYTHHHILMDGWSNSQLLGEVLQHYAGECPEKAPGRYRDYIAWLGQQDDQESQLFWKQQLKAFESPTYLAQAANAIERQPSESLASHGELLLAMDTLETRALSDLARELKVTVNTLVQAAWMLLLQRYTGQDSVTFGVTVAGRPTELRGIEQQVGLFINTLPMMGGSGSQDNLVDWLPRLQHQNLMMREYGHTPLFDIQRWAQSSAEALFDTLLVFENYPVSQALEKGAPQGLKFGEVRNHQQTNYPLTLLVAMEERLILHFLYANEAFDQQAIERIAHHLKDVLLRLVKHRHTALGTLLSDWHPLQSDAWRRGASVYAGDQCVHQRVEAQVEKSPHGVALVFADQQLTYEQLNHRANQLAHALIERGVGPDTLVGLMVDRGQEMVVGLLAILKAGGAYVPFDPEYPQERLAYMVNDSKVALLLTQARLRDTLPFDNEALVLCLDQVEVQQQLATYPESNPVNRTSPDNLAYMLYTSGSTGRPKGIAMPHRVISQLNAWQHERLPGALRTLLFASPCFDVAFQEVTSGLCTGGTLVQTDDNQRRDFSLLLDVISTSCIERIYLPFAVLQLFAEAALSSGRKLPDLKQIITAGEQLKLTSTLTTWLEAESQCSLINQYGPTESHVVSDFLVSDLYASQLPPIGSPASNAHLYILDTQGRTVPQGMAGELYIGANVLARGYFNRPALTAERFIPDPFDETGGNRLYRTSDLCRHRADGVIDYIGRIDHQVKIRGYRIELGEIEARLLAHEWVSEAAVIDIDAEAGKQLVAYVVPREASVQENRDAQHQWRRVLKEHLNATLPEYMVPAHWLFLEALPLTSNGKLNRKALPRPDASLVQQDFVAPKGDLEEKIADIWADVLKLERVGRHDNFFDIGGHSLLATQVVSRVRQALHLELPLRLLFEEPELAGFAGQLIEESHPNAAGITRIDRNQPLALSYAQQRQWFLWKLEPGSCAYHIPAALRFRGALDVAALTHSFQRLINRHETLRTIFSQDDNQAVQHILPAYAFTLERDTWRASGTGRSADIQAYVETEVNRPFDLEKGSLLRARLLQLDEQDHVLIVTLHHIVTDGWSIAIMIDELVALYEGYRQNVPVEPAPLPVQYVDYAAWQRGWMDAGERDRQLAYWQAQLGGEQPILALATDYPRPLMQSHAGARLDIVLPRELAGQLRALAQRQGVTLFMTLLASFQTLLHRYTGQPDIRVGVPIANRTRGETEKLIGFFVNTQVLKAEFDLETTFGTLLQQVKRRALGAQAHQDLPFEQLVEVLQPQRSLSHSPLFQVMYNHQSALRAPLKAVAGISIETLPWNNPTAQFDLTLDTYEHADDIHASLSYVTALFKEQTIRRMSQRWVQILRDIVAQPDARLGELPVLDSTEQNLLLHEWNRAAVAPPAPRCIHHLIEEQVAQAPDAVAIVCQGQQLTYRQLDRRANDLADELIKRRLRPGALVGIALERSVDMVVGILAILKAGAAYVPLDPDYPGDRLAYMIEDSGIDLLLTHTRWRDQLCAPASLDTLLLDDWAVTAEEETDQRIEGRPDSLAYVIYTSGSTGKPKGVRVAQGTFAMHCHAVGLRYGIDRGDRVLQSASLNFDAAAEQLFMPLVFGASLLLEDIKHLSGHELIDVIEQNGVTVVDLPPAYIATIVQDIGHARLRTRVCILGGEGWTLNMLGDVIDAEQVFNAYGPTEAVATPLVWSVDLTEPFEGYAPIGTCVGQRRSYILDDALQLIQPGRAAELYLGGQGLAQGYHRRPAMTAERFIPDPFDESEPGGGRLYRTGDLARHRSDGVIEYLGRTDHQVKIRGLRIELGEIEAQLMALDQVREAVAVAQPGLTGQQLVGYVVLHDTVEASDWARHREQIRKALLQRLPEYMVPAHWVLLDALPLTPNGKLDRQALPQADYREVRQAYVAPHSQLEQRIAAIWADVLKLDSVGVTDNFFELGGDSIISIQLVSRARQAGIRFTPKDLFQHQTVQALALASSEGEDGGLQIEQGAAVGELALMPVQQSFFELEMTERHHWNQSFLLIPGHHFEGGLLEQALQSLVVHHDALRLSFVQQRNGEWKACYGSVDELQGVWQREPLLWQATLDTHDELQALCNEAQRSLKLQDGSLMRAVLATLPDGSQRLLLAIHHLVVDGVSWRILFEDLQTAYTQLQDNQRVRLPAKTSGLNIWVERLQHLASQAALQLEFEYWKSVLGDVSVDLPGRPLSSPPCGADAFNINTQLSPAYTHKLLHHAPAAYRTQINDLLLTALARVVVHWTKTESVLIQLEGHGREDLFSDVDLTRTVGWFTSLFPVKLTPAQAWADSIKQIKEQLRSVPDKGLGFGILRYLGDAHMREHLAALPEPKITFNYLGQFGDVTSDRSSEGDVVEFLRPASEHPGDALSPQAPLDNWLSINGEIYAGTLNLGWTFSREMFDIDTIQALADAYAQELMTLIEHCTDERTAGVTPSDFPLVRMTQAELDELPIPAALIEDIYPLSPMQQGMLFHSLYEQEAGEYINQMRMDVTGLEVERFKKAWLETLAAHDILRTGFVWQGLEQAVQVVYREAQLPFTIYDFSASTDQPQALDTLASETLTKGFVLSQAPLQRLDVVMTGQQTHHLIYTSHHILMDGWSNSQLLGEVLQRYAGHGVAPASGRYRDYIAWLQQQDKQASEMFWGDQLKALQEPTRLSQALARSGHVQQVNSHEGHDDLYQVLDRDQTRHLAEFARQQKVTLNTVIQAAWLLLLQRYTGLDTVTFGATVSGRPADLRGVEQQIGLFINTLPVVSTPRAEQTFSDWLQALQKQSLLLREQEHTPLFEIQRWAGRSGEALFDTLLVFENYPVAEALEQGAPRDLQFTGVQHYERTNYPMTVAMGLGDELTLHYSYIRTHFSPSQVAEISTHFAALLTGCIHMAGQAIGAFSLLDEVEQRQLQAWSHAGRSCESGSCIHELFEQQVKSSPEAVAVVCGHRQMTYQQLNKQANRLAHKLRDLGVGPDALVGLAVERSIEMVVGLLAILKAGAAYVPLDPQYPEDRLTYMIKDSGVSLLLTQADVSKHVSLPTDVQVLHLDTGAQWLEGYSESDPGIEVLPGQLAYVIYTSGSTGQPKGAAVRRASFVNLLHWFKEACRFTVHDKLLLVSSYSFDLTQKNIYGILCGGGQLHLAAPGYDPDAYRQQIAEHSITVLNCAPSAFYPLLKEDCSALASLKHVLLGGEAIQPGELAGWMQSVSGMQVTIHNTYGPTECTDVVIAHATRHVSAHESLPVGRPLPGTRIYLLGSGGDPVPIGQEGEIHIGGNCVGEGYWRRPALTAERFIPDPYDESEEGGGRLYRTGDLARFQPEGLIDYVGRIDHQVKIRGVRIELGEIQSTLQKHSAVRDAVVIDIEVQTGKQLAAYVVTAEPLPVEQEHVSILRTTLRDHLKASLPDYMVPAHLVFLQALPLTPNGKLDRKALPALEVSHNQQVYVAPQSEWEQQLADLWAEVLGVEQVGMADSFFELGGDSIISIQLVSRCRQAGIHFTPKELFQYQTVPLLASVARRGELIDRPVDQGPLTGEGLLLPIHQYFFDKGIPEPHHWNQALLLTPGALLDARVLEQALEALVLHHDALRLSFVPSSDGQWQVRYTERPLRKEAEKASALLWQVDVQDQAELERVCTDTQRSLDLQHGPLLRALLVRLPDASQRLLIAIHHLAVDGVSWRILLEDLQSACEQVAAGQKVSLSAKTTSTRDWAEHLQVYARSDAAHHELAYWRAQSVGVGADLPCDDPQGSLLASQVGSVETRLDQACTRQLLQDAPAAYRTQVNDLLLSALVRVLARWTGHNEVLVQLEGHGREDIFEPVDLTRTVGWFTSMYPVKLTAESTLEASIKRVKEQLRAIPNKGIGFGALRYLGDESARTCLAGLPTPRITFNYLGQFDSSFDVQPQPAGTHPGQAFLTPASESAGDSQSAQAPLGNWLSINGQVYGGELSLDWSFSRDMFKTDTIAWLADEYARELKQVIEHCTHSGTGGMTPSDLVGVEMDQQALDCLLDEIL